VFSNLGPVWTEPELDWVQRVFEICKPYVEDRLEARTAPYMTDAANLLKCMQGAPTVVLGPGEAAMAHQTDEYCSMERIRQSVAIYEALIRRLDARMNVWSSLAIKAAYLELLPAFVRSSQGQGRHPVGGDGRCPQAHPRRRSHRRGRSAPPA
jgi:hypothetical protein